MFLKVVVARWTDELNAEMETAASTLDFERVAQIRDQIFVEARPGSTEHGGGNGDVDVIAAFVNPVGLVCILINVRGGRCSQELSASGD